MERSNDSAMAQSNHSKFQNANSAWGTHLNRTTTDAANTVPSTSMDTRYPTQRPISSTTTTVYPPNLHLHAENHSKPYTMSPTYLHKKHESMSNYTTPREDTEEESLFTDLLLARDREPPHRGTPCNQDLLPNMHQHWGESHFCAAHAPNHNGIRDFRVCKGCRVAHYAHTSHDTEKAVVMARGARVPVCEACTMEAVADAEGGVRMRKCRCDSRWMCFVCREDELGRLARARRERFVEGKCGMCGVEREMVEYAEFCVCCERWRVYAVGS